MVRRTLVVGRGSCRHRPIRWRSRASSLPSAVCTKARLSYGIGAAAGGCGGRRIGSKSTIVRCAAFSINSPKTRSIPPSIHSRIGRRIAARLATCSTPSAPCTFCAMMSISPIGSKGIGCQRAALSFLIANGLLDVEGQRLIPHTPLFFNQTSVPFDFDPNAPKPQRWLSFLDQLWPNDPAAINVLGEWFGYVISGRTDLHKILLMVGPPRGGKGVIARILTALIGRQNVAGPTLNSLGGEFGLAPLIGKSLAIISDARFAGKNSNIVVERLLSISGEDTLTVNRKYRDQWTGKLPCRLHVISNELPRLGDASTAIVGRIVLLLLSNSWLGKENHDLELNLSVELSSILNWSLSGLHRKP